MCRKNKVASVSHASSWTSFTKIWKQPSICKNSKMLGASDFTFIRCFWILQSSWLIQQFPYFAKWFCVPGVQPVRQRPCVDCFHGSMFFCFAEDSETMLWGLTGTPCLDDFANVAKLVRACSDIDLLVFRRQLDAKDLVTWKNVLADLLMECGPISGKCESILAIFARCLMSFVPKQLSFACYVLHGVIIWKAIRISGATNSGLPGTCQWRFEGFGGI